MVVGKLGEEIFKDATDQKDVTVTGKICSWHREDKAIDIALEKAELFDDIIYNIKYGVCIDEDWIESNIENKDLLK